MAGVARSGFQAVATAVWSLVAVASRAVNTTLWNGSAVATPNVAGYPLVDLRYVLGNLINAMQAGRIDAYLGARAVGMLGWTVDQYEESVAFTLSNQDKDVTIPAIASGASWVLLQGHHNGHIARYGILNATTVRFRSQDASSPGTITVAFSVIQGPE